MKRGLRGIACLCLMGCVLSAVGSAPNLYPEGTYEKLGTTAVARTGKGALHHVMPTPVRYLAKGTCALKVEPYAVYEASGYVKGRVPSGMGEALVFYGWNSFGWSFMSRVRLPRVTPDWTRVSTRFCVPVAKVTFMPLVLANVRSGDVWLDDVQVVKVQDASAHLRELLGKKVLTRYERQLLARHHLSSGRQAEALALREGADSVARADITCLVALGAKELGEVRRWTVDLLSQECLQWADGKLRVRDLLGRFPVSEQIEICRAAFAQRPTAKVLASLDYVTIPELRSLSMAEARELTVMLRRQYAAFRARTAELGGSFPALGRLEKRVVALESAVSSREASMGHCVLRLRGEAVSRENTVVVLPQSPTPSELTASQELIAHVELLTGVSLRCVGEAQLSRQDRRYPILIGRSADLARHGFTVDYAALGTEGIQVENNGRALLLAGGQRGVLYAVYSFLEERLGCRWFAPDCQVMPRQGTLEPGVFRQVYVPALSMRSTSRSPYLRRMPFPVRMKLNSIVVPQEPKWGGNIHYRGYVHTMGSLVPWRTYHDSHPEYYALRDGMRTTNKKAFQLCLTNPEVLKIATATVLKWCAESPDAQIVSVSQNDNTYYCQCPACMALAEKEGSQMGPLLHFVNAIAREVKKRYPDKIVDTLAYTYTRKPPKHVRPESNVAIRLCSIECCFVHPLESCPYNKTFVEDIVGWSKICNRLHVWDYVTNFAHYIQPFPNLRVLQSNIRFFIDHHVISLHEQSNGASAGGEMAPLRNYLVGKLLWNPEEDVDRLILEFTDAYYGAAGGKLREYVSLIHDTVCSKADGHVRIYTAPGKYLNDRGMLLKGLSLLDEASALVADDPVRLQRVKVAKLPVLYVLATLYHENMFLQGTRLVYQSGKQETWLEEFERIARSEGVTQVREAWQPNLESWLELHKAGRSGTDILTLKNDALSLDILPSLGGRIWRIRAAGKAGELLRVTGDEKHGFTPREGGMEWYSTDRHMSPGFVEPYQVVRQGADFVELAATLRNGRRMTRKIELLKDRAGFRVTNEVESLNGKGSVVFRCHPEFAVSRTRDCVLLVKGLDGKEHAYPLVDRKDGRPESEKWLTGKNMPAGEWSIWDKGTGIRLVNRFQTDEVGMCYCNWHRDNARVNLELWSKAKAPGKGVKVRTVVDYEFSWK